MFHLFDTLQDEYVEYFSEQINSQVVEENQYNKHMRDKTYISFFFRLDDKFRIYKRRTDNIMDFLSEIGGILEIVLAVGFFVTSPFVTRHMNTEMVNAVYHVQRYSKD